MVKLPKKIELRAMKTQWRVSYIKTPGKLMIVEHSSHRLTLCGKNYTKLSACTLLTNWVKLKASQYLIALVEKLNRRVKVKYRKVMLRSHIAQWGSCTPKKIISLNYQLIFLPLPLVKNLILHELCHLKYWNHSDAFWEELKKFDIHYDKHDELLNEADKYLPEWLVW